MLNVIRTYVLFPKGILNVTNASPAAKAVSPFAEHLQYTISQYKVPDFFFYKYRTNSNRDVLSLYSPFGVLSPFSKINPITTVTESFGTLQVLNRNFVQDTFSYRILLP